MKKYAVFILLFLLLFIGTAHAALIDGLVSYYDGDGTSCLTNRNTTGDNLTAVNGAGCTANGKIANGYLTSASTTQYFNGTNSGAPVGTNARTLCFWGNASNTGDYRHIVNMGAPITDNLLGLYLDPSRVPTLHLYTDDTPFTGVTATQNQWAYYCLAYNGAGNIATYFNGINTNNMTETLGGTSTIIRFGVASTLDTSNYVLTGVVDEVGVWARALTSEEVVSLYNAGAGNAYPFSGAITPSPSFVAPTPASGSVNNTNVVINVSCGTNLTTLWFDTSATPTTKVINNLSLGNYTTQASSTQTYYYKAACYNSTTGMSANSSVQNWTYDAVFPTITVNPTNEFNPQNYSRRSPYDKLVHLNFTIADDHDVYGFSVNITRGGVVFFNYSNETLSGRTQYNYTATLNSATWATGTYNVTVMASDTHTKSAIGDYNIAKSNKKLEFYTDKGINVIVESNEDAVTSSEKKGDRYDFTYDFTDSSKKKRWFDLSASAPITYLPNSPYQGHFIIGGEHWLDFEGQGIVSDVKALGNNRYRITFNNLDSDVTFHSIGGLNIYQANFTFYHGNYSYNNPFALATDPTTLFSNFTHDTTTIANISTTFLYNGTLQTVTASNTSSYFFFTSTMTAPNATMLQLFNWSVTVTQRDGNSSTFNITDNQNISLVTVSVCGATPIINFTSYDENTPTNKLSIVPQVLFTYYTGNSSLTKVLNTTMANNSVFSLCITPSYASVHGDLYIQYLADLSQYTHRYYVFNGSYTNTTTTYNIYNWNNTGASLLKIITRYNSDYGFYPNVLTHLERRYIGENVWRIVQMDESGDYGLISFHIRELDTDYRLTYYDEDYHVLKQTDSLKFSCTSFLCELTQTLTPWEGSTSGDNFSTGFTYNNVTKLITLTWSDPDLATNSVNFTVIKGSDRTTICGILQSGSSGSATCNVSNYTGSVFSTVSLNGDLTDSIWFTVIGQNIGQLLTVAEASFWAGGIIIIVMMTSIFSPVAVLVSGFVGIFVVFQFGIMPWITTTFIVISIVVGIFIAVKVKS